MVALYIYIYMSFVQMRRAWNDIPIYCMSFTLRLINFFRACFLQRKFPLVFFIPSDMNSENFIHIYHKHFVL